jgi:hypothetical protein
MCLWYKAVFVIRALPCGQRGARDYNHATMLFWLVCLQVVAGSAPQLRMTAQEAKVPLERNWEFSAASPGGWRQHPHYNHLITAHHDAIQFFTFTSRSTLS